jgi:hypothetical protein
MRSTTLRAVSEQALRGQSLSLCLRDFLDAFRLQPSQAALDEEPPLLAGMVEEGALYDAYLAATAEALASEKGLDTPPWTHKPGRALKHPWFAVPWAGMRAVLILESPAAFRSRNLFVSANALARA